MGRKSRNTFSAQFPFPTSSGPLGSNRPAFSISIPPGGGAAAHLYGSLTTCRGNHDSFCIPQAAGVASSSSSSYSSNSSGCGNKTGSIKIKTVCRPTGLEDNKTKWQFTILFTSCRQQEENLVVWVNSSTQSPKLYSPYSADPSAKVTWGVSQGKGTSKGASGPNKNLSCSLR